MAPRERAQSCQASSSLRGCDGAAGHHDRADVSGRRSLGWKTRNGVSAKYSVKSTSSQPNRRSGRSMPKRRIASAYVIRGIGSVDLVADDLAPQPGDQRLDQRLDVLGVAEAHLDVELGELGLPVGPEVLVAEAAGDLEVALEAGHHQQLLEQLRRLRQRVPVTRAAAAPAPGSRGRPRGSTA